MATRFVRPHPLLQPFVQSFCFREAVVTEVQRFPITARPVQFIEFYLRDRYRVIDFASGLVTSAPRIVVLGQQTHRLSDLYLRGDYANFTIHFQPTGFHRLFGIAMSELTDHAIAADALLGRTIDELHEQLQQSESLFQLVQRAEQFLLGKVGLTSPLQPVEWVAQSILAGHGLVSLDQLQAASGLSLRQLERQFDCSIGVTPKRYARIVRFQHALTLAQRSGDQPWARIAAEAGYFDQMHLIKDFRTFSGQTPTDLNQAVRTTGSWNTSEQG